MNENKIRKYMADIQIAMGKILEEIDQTPNVGVKKIRPSLSDELWKDEDTSKVMDYGEELDHISDALKNTTIVPMVEVEEEVEDIAERIRQECASTEPEEFDFNFDNNVEILNEGNKNKDE